MTEQSEGAQGSVEPKLRRALPLSLVVLYGLGVTIGAGIYVLIGTTAARAGIHAPIAFIIAAAVMAFSAAGFAELSGRFPVSAGEAAFVRAGFGSRRLATLVGLMVVAVGSISSAAISLGSVGYLRTLVDAPDALLTVIVVVAMASVAAVGILQSVMFAALMTLIEIGGLVAIVAAGALSDAPHVTSLPQVWSPGLGVAAWSGIVGASLLAFFAFIGFEDLVNIAEETENPEYNMPWAIFLTLAVSTLLYAAVVSVAVMTVPAQELGASRAPLSLVFERTTNFSPTTITVIALVATFNGIIVQIIMASRVIYGLASEGELPRQLGAVHRVTRTPIVATALVAAIILVLALCIPLERLAETTSMLTLTIFALVNAALVRLKLKGQAPPNGGFTVPLWVPVFGFLASTLFLGVNLVAA